jgi:hypothetical protein
MKLQPFDLLDFFFLVLIAMVSGTLVAIVPFPTAVVAPPPPPQVERPAPPPPPPNTGKQLEKLEAASAELLQQWNLISAQLQSARAEAERLDQERRQREELIEKLRKLAAEKFQDSGGLREKLAFSESEIRRKAAEAERLNEQMRQLRSEMAHLEEKLAHTPPVAPDADSERNSQRAPVARPTDKKPEVIEFVGDRAVPVDKDHFSFYSAGNAVLAVRKDGVTGEAAGEMDKPGSKFLSKLRGLDKDKQFLFCLVNDDSFKAFRRARSIAERMQIGVGWEPYDSKDRKIVFGPRGRRPRENY